MEARPIQNPPTQPRGCASISIPASCPRSEKCFSPHRPQGHGRVVRCGEQGQARSGHVRPPAVRRHRYHVARSTGFGVHHFHRQSAAILAPARRQTFQQFLVLTGSQSGDGGIHHVIALDILAKRLVERVVDQLIDVWPNSVQDFPTLCERAWRSSSRTTRRKVVSKPSLARYSRNARLMAVW